MTPQELQALRRRTAAIIRILVEQFEHVEMRPEHDSPRFTESLVATILSQNTTDANSNRAYQALRSRYSTWRSVARAPHENLVETIRVAGLAEAKARTIRTALETIYRETGGYDPDEFTENDEQLLARLTSIPGVGLKTAACVLMFSLNRDVCAVDTHVHRVVNRLGLVSTSTPDKTFRALAPLLPAGRAREAHVAMILFGRQICKAQRPHCYECPVFALCEWPERHRFALEMRPGAAPASGNLLLLEVIRGGAEVASRKSKARGGKVEESKSRKSR